MSSFDPHINLPDGKPYKAAKYESIIEEQVRIAYYSKGTISISETDNMTPYDRNLVMKFLKEIVEEENNAAAGRVN